MPAQPHPIDILLADPDFRNLVNLLACEVQNRWTLPYSAARGFVISALAHPDVAWPSADRSPLAFELWMNAKATGQGMGFVKVVIRRRVIDLIRKDMRPPREVSSDTLDEASKPATSAYEDRLTPNDHVVQQDLIKKVREALEKFGNLGRVQQRQASLLRRHVFDGASYEELALEIGTSRTAVGVRLFKAREAFGRFIEKRYPELKSIALEP